MIVSISTTKSYLFHLPLMLGRLQCDTTILKYVSVIKAMLIYFEEYNFILFTITITRTYRRSLYNNAYDDKVNLRSRVPALIISSFLSCKKSRQTWRVTTVSMAIGSYHAPDLNQSVSSPYWDWAWDDFQTVFGFFCDDCTKFLLHFFPWGGCEQHEWMHLSILV